MTDRQRRALIIVAAGAVVLAVGFVAIEFLGASNLGPELWRAGPLSALGYAMIGAPTAIIVGFAAIAAVNGVFYSLAAVFGIGRFVVTLPRRIVDWTYAQGAPGMLGLSLLVVVVTALIAAFIWLGGGFEALVTFWVEAAIAFGFAAFIGACTGGFLLRGALALLGTWAPNSVKQRLVAPNPSLVNGAVATGSVAASYPVWLWNWNSDLVYTAATVPDRATSTPAGAYALLTATAAVTFLVLRSVRVFRDRHRLLSRSARTPIWSTTDRIDPEPVGMELWSNEPVIGWRVWTWNSTSLVGGRESWKASTKIATCERPAPCPEPPGWDCNCGIYAYKEADSLWWDVDMREVIWGQVRMEGRVIEHDDGYRASKATMQRLWVLTRSDPKKGLLDVLSRKHPDVKVSVVNERVRRTGGDSRRAMLEV